MATSIKGSPVFLDPLNQNIVNERVLRSHLQWKVQRKNFNRGDMTVMSEALERRLLTAVCKLCNDP